MLEETLKNIVYYIVLPGSLLIVFAVLFFTVRENSQHKEYFEMSVKILVEQVKLVRRMTDRRAPVWTNVQEDDKTAPPPQLAQVEFPENETARMVAKKRNVDQYALIKIPIERADFKSFIQKRNIGFSKANREFLLEVRMLKHDNIASLLGLQYNDFPTSELFVIFHTFVEKGTIESFCEDPDMRVIMNENFKSAFMRDILRGVKYLHKSKVGYHGFLLAANCLIDSHWIVKLSFSGVTNFLCDQMQAGNIEDSVKYEQVTPVQFSQLPPEHLQELDPKNPKLIRGSAKGDLYCIGMIFYMLIEMKVPFDLNNFHKYSARSTIISDLLEKNKRPKISREHYRIQRDTDMGEIVKDEEKILDICSKCWNRNPDLRPSLEEIHEAVSNSYPMAKGRLVEQMLRIAERKAEEEEQKVEEKKAQIEAEMNTTRTLLNEMLPPSIADQLLKTWGEGTFKVIAESHDSVTVMFVCVCDFLTFQKKLSPQQTIFFLNQVYDLFDTVVERYDAYKVETIGETYMVASGVPKGNGGLHVGIMANVGLDIRKKSTKYRFSDFPDYRLKIRTGFHTGPLATGVIGQKAPRYCLFGDTVNVASRMQSSGAPNKIQTSETTARMLIETGDYKLAKRGYVLLKGKGDVICYWLEGRAHPKSGAEPEQKTTTSA